MFKNITFTDTCEHSAVVFHIVADVDPSLRAVTVSIDFHPV